MLIKVNAQNDTNGNPRRGWISYDLDGRFLGFYPEGYDDGGEVLRKLKANEEVKKTRVCATTESL